MAQSSSSCSQRSSSVTTCTSCTKEKKGKALRRATRLTYWHEEEAQSRMFASCTRVQRRFSYRYLLSLSSSYSKPLPPSSPNELEDSSPEPILSKSRPRSTPSIVVHTQSVRAKKDLGKNRQEALSDLHSSSDNSKTSDGNPWLSWYGRLDAAAECDHNAIRPWTDEKMTSEIHYFCCKGSVEWSRHERHFCSLLPYFLLSWLQIFQLCLSFWTSSFDMVLFEKFFQEKKNIWKTSQNALAPSIFIVWSIVLKLGTPLLHIQAQKGCYKIFNFAPEVEIWTKNLQKRCFTQPGRLWRSITFFVGRN